MQNRAIIAEPVEPEYLEQFLRGLGEFYYWPNEGNLGDYLIAEATRQVFRRNGLVWKEYRPESPPEEESYTIVYGGGGRFVPHWGGMDLFEEHLTRPQVRKCIILPHSIQGVDEFVSALDERHSVFCRDRKTLSYCRALNSRAEFTLAHDMGLGLSVSDLPGLAYIEPLKAGAEDEDKTQYKLLKGGGASHAWHRMKLSTVKVGGYGNKVTFVLRTDKEKSVQVSSDFAYDLSILYAASCRETPYSAQIVRLMADLLSCPDVVVTDRLHVAIMAMHVGKEVYMLDNDYGKLSGVYEVSLANRENVHLLPAGKAWPMQLRMAWFQLNAPWRRCYYAARAYARQLLNKLRSE